MNALMNLNLVEVQIVAFGILAALFLINVFIDSFTINLIMGAFLGIGIGATQSLRRGFLVVGDDFKHLSAITIATFILVFILFVVFYKFIAPMSERTNKTSAKDYEGVVGEVVTTIPKDGVGEVMLTVTMQRVSKQAKFFQGKETEGLEEIKQGQSVLIIENSDFLYVVPYTKAKF